MVGLDHERHGATESTAAFATSRSTRGAPVTVAIIVLAVALAGALGVIVTLGAWLRTANVDNAKQRGENVAEARRGDQLEHERDLITADRNRLVTERLELLDRLDQAEEQRNAVIANEVAHVVERIRTSSDPADAARAIDELLSRSLPGARAPGPTAAGDSDRGTPAVQPAPAAGPGGDGRSDER